MTYRGPSGGGELGAAIRAHDWSGTPIGAFSEWPPSLRAVTTLVLESRFPMYVAWGPERVQVYNDACRSFLGRRHPRALGARAPDSLGENWKSLEPLFAAVYEGRAQTCEDMRLSVDRDGGSVGYFTLSCSPIRRDDGAVGGLLMTVAETTQRILEERRTSTLREIAAEVASAETEARVWTHAARVLEQQPDDVPVALLYARRSGGSALDLAATVGIEQGSVPAALARLTLAGAPWPFAEAESGARLVRDSAPIGSLRDPPIDAAPAVIVPVAPRGQPESHCGFLVIGMDPGLAFDEGYRRFLETAGEEIGAAVCHTRALARARRRIAHREDRFYALLRDAPAAIAITHGPEHVFEFSNPRHRALIGDRDVLGLTAREAFPELAGTDAFAVLDRAYREAEEIRMREYAAPVADASGEVELRWFDWIAMPLHDAVDAVEGVMTFAYEVTEQVRAREAAEAATRAKDDFLAILGHELRNPLAPIVTTLDIMRLRDVHAFAKERRVIERQVRHLTRLVDDLLDVSRLARGDIELRRRTIELAQAVTMAIEMASPLIEEREHRLEVDVPDQGLLVDGDESRLAQVVSNLLTNAARYTEPGGTIRVSAGALDGDVRLCVEDDGQGIDDDDLDRLFDMFTRSPGGGSAASTGGLGLGLTIVRSLVELHGGSVVANSEGPGKGSRFEIVLPRLEAPARSAGTTDRSGEASPERLRILVVDDNVDAATALAEVLEMSGQEVMVAHDGPAALELKSDFDPHVVLLDIGLPAMDGYEVAGRMRTQRLDRELLLVAVTGFGQDNDRARALAAGFDEHLVKPVDTRRILRLIDAHAGGSAPAAEG